MAKLLEPDPSTRMLRITTAFNDVLYSSANEPSLGMYRIQEHVNVTVPRLVEQQRQLRENCQRVEGARFDLEYDARTLRGMAGITQFKGIKNRLLRAVELKKKLDEVEMRKQATHSLPPVATSLSPTSPAHPHTHTPSHLSLPPTLTEATPTPISSKRNDDSALLDGTHAQEPASDLGIRPKTFD